MEQTKSWSSAMKADGTFYTAMLCKPNKKFLIFNPYFGPKKKFFLATFL